MPTSLYNFQYVPLTGRLPGKSFVSQTEQAINGLAQYVYDNSTNYEAVKAIAQKAEEDSSAALEYSEEALDKAQTALETVGRAYIKTTSAVDLDDYFDSELLLILSTESTNLPASISGYLTVMSSDTHDYCMQVYIGIDGSVYKRTATISNNTPTFGAWSETPITLSSLQTILANYTTVDASNIGVNAQTDNSTSWGNAIGGGEIVSGEQRLVTGDTVYESEYQLEQKVEIDIGVNDKRITNIEKLLQGNLYDYQTDSTSAYTKSVPAGAMPYAGLEKVGGETIVMNQLFPNPSTTYTANGNVAFNSGTSFIAGHKYFCKFDYTYSDTPYWNNGATVFDRINGNNVNVFILNIQVGAKAILTANYSATSNGTASVTEGNCWTYVYMTTLTSVYNINYIDLTLMFGPGNEPSTVAEFESMFPAEWYPYSAPTLLSAGVTEVVSKDGNNATLQTYSIPAEIQALEGYGWSAGMAYNYVDFERKKFVKNVARVDLGSLNYTYFGDVTSVARFVHYFDDIKSPATNDDIANIECPLYITVNANEWKTGTADKIIWAWSGEDSGYIGIMNKSYSTAASFKEAMSGVYLYYELATPQEIDISAYLTDDNLINVESGGTLTFENQHGDDYRIPVPSKEEYMIDLQEALS